MKRRTVITGLGWVTSLGETIDGVWDDLCAGKSGIGPVTRFDLSKYPTSIGGECTKFDLNSYQEEAARYSTERLLPKRLDRFGQFGIAASLSAVRDAGIDFDKCD